MFSCRRKRVASFRRVVFHGTAEEPFQMFPRPSKMPAPVGIVPPSRCSAPRIPKQERHQSVTQTIFFPSTVKSLHSQNELETLGCSGPFLHCTLGAWANLWRCSISPSSLFPFSSLTCYLSAVAGEFFMSVISHSRRRLGRDPETANHRAAARRSLIFRWPRMSLTKTKTASARKRTEWHKIVVWSKLAKSLNSI